MENSWYGEYCDTDKLKQIHDTDDLDFLMEESEHNKGSTNACSG